jgi:broad specificity phosphatase PhoE
MRLFLIRHAESTANTLNDGQKRDLPDHLVPLTDRGIEQARECGKFLNSYLEKNKPNINLSFTGNPQVSKAVEGVLGQLGGILNDKNLVKGFNENLQSLNKMKIWTSPYVRARDTASIIRTNCFDKIKEVEENLLLTEQQFGLFDNLSNKQRKEMYPNEWEQYNNIKKFNGEFWARYPYGESMYDVSIRVEKFFSILKSESLTSYSGDVIVVCHGNVIKAFANLWAKKKFEYINEEKTTGNCSIRLFEDNIDKGLIFGGFKYGEKVI